MKRLLRFLGFGVTLTVAVASAQPQPTILVFAAASLKTALDELAPLIEREAMVRLRVSYAASPALARQIEAGAPAAIFISADLEWMDYLSAKSLIRPETRTNLLGGRLVLIAPAGRPMRLRIAPGFDIRGALGAGRLAVADPSSVPAGKYAREALTSLGVWQNVADRLAPAENVRAALLLVARGESPLGIVYATDAAAEPGVAVVDSFAESLHQPIVYPIALTMSAADAPARRVLAALQSAAAADVFRRQGFAFLPR